MKEIALIISFIIIILIFFGACSTKTSLEIPGEITPQEIASILSDEAELISLDEIDQYQGFKVEGVAAAYEAKGTVIFYALKLDKTFKARMLFEKSALKAAFGIKKYFETFSYGNLSYVKNGIYTSIIWSGRWVLVVQGFEKSVKDFIEKLLAKLTAVVS